MFEYFQKGGPVMYFILLLSVYGVSIVIERFYFFYKASFNYRAFMLDIKRMIMNKEVEHALMLLRRTPGPLGAIMSQSLNLVSNGSADLRSRINEIGAYEVQKSEGRLKHLAVIGNIAPLLGLLGTVTGMMTAFSAISLKGANTPTVVAGGISEALITTAYGLIVAIPAVFAYNYLSSRYENIVLETERAASEFVDFIEKGMK
ncbi:MAG TPA: MotA/TolQ/ExbB proton channel family protein [Candidatus Wallbacteria bacterium]|nr:MAG: Biopolymer transport protein ExbB [bacterium ADurb.Bin243]HOD40474.1 MotA/TolQ/ExbB proton channel family protein [Candidatus Wallbacteria bacterium]HPG57203.1 MotA/TolQ/ExbB proton channel family protein [Candidatus Wallbacteria bacterium]